ncbi:transcription repressor NadR [Streptococcus dysgalactiae subsp. equisimilis]|uniref:transcription repressor NadR n=1 Tax=Streptococcus dysgalactiae TaxID=1334 RepID=UPI001F1387BF|nr:transcription repressor NadR [Streptococcus dysgalactiae]MCL6221137.1 transcription repressor NadR [Streptococcus dysgalactiae subsp. equisimilis]UMY67551.1 transcription repressor NadR [Streptococcus dysgalactiae subsp. equisimilis]
MKAEERRQKIIEYLTGEQEALSATYLAKLLGVSRQVIVGDVALLRAQQIDIISTPKGYIMSTALFSHQFCARIVCQHGLAETEKELQIILAHQGIITTVEVEHPIYGMITAPLNIKSQSDVTNFMKKLNHSNAELLSSLTEGLHSHLISCPSREAFEAMSQDLEAAGILYTGR